MKNSLKGSTKTSKNIIGSKSGRIILIILLALCCYPVYSFLQLQSIEGKAFDATVFNNLLSIWITWIIIICFAVYWKWSRQHNSLFYLTYGYLLLIFGALMFMVQQVSGGTSHTYFAVGGYPDLIFLVIEHFLGTVALTGFLQILVWWFTRRWHRR
ncbi:hypothetical protein [Autumnicola musiva]|uniref:Uncharacterized protein n=1 Tax=Autumnicola musiva TaxID=3075589 RepID=A0ABU3D537_9FLAO|nr:hypothetical protein [Zunongwangia sp. F117]MDT0676645.1 hypothetical protein [Zunongwangia sp. F117]